MIRTARVVDTLGLAMLVFATLGAASVASAQRRRAPRGAAAPVAVPTAEAVSCEGVIRIPNQETLRTLFRSAASHTVELSALSMCEELNGHVWGIKLNGLETRMTNDTGAQWAEGTVELTYAEQGNAVRVEVPIALGGDSPETIARIRIVDLDGDHKPELFVERVIKQGATQARHLRSILEFRNGQFRTILGDAIPGTLATPAILALGRVVDVEDIDRDNVADRVHVTRGFHVDQSLCEGGGYGGEIIGSAWRAHRNADGSFVVDDAAPTTFAGNGGCAALVQSRSFRHFGFDTIGRAIMCFRARGDNERDILFRVAAYCRRFETMCVSRAGDLGGVSDTGESTDIVCPAYWQEWARHTPPTQAP